MSEQPLLTGRQLWRFARSRHRDDDGAIIAAWAAMQFQDQPTHWGNQEYVAEVTLDAWGDAINGGIVIC